MSSVPLADVRLPAEWEPQSGVLLTWPHDEGDWKGLLPRVEPALIAMTVAISQRERVVLACSDVAHTQALLENTAALARNVQFLPVPSNDIWARDHGPIAILREGRPELLDFAFNGWGLKYPAYDDNQIGRRLARLGAFSSTPMTTLGLVLEGGSIESDGHGALLTTSRCLLSPNRNPHLAREDLERELHRILGASRVLWIENGWLEGDDTDAHVDTLVRFCDAHTLTYVSAGDARGEEADSLRAMEAQLRTFRTASDDPYRLVPLPMPRPVYNDEGDRLPATYANFLIINGAVLTPTYHCPQDADALQVVTACFPDREIIPIDGIGLVLQFGSVHCASMQFPQGVLP